MWKWVAPGRKESTCHDLRAIDALNIAGGQRSADAVAWQTAIMSMLYAPAASHAAAGATKLGSRRTWGHVFDGMEGGACRFIPGGIPVERPSPDAWGVVAETWL